MPGRLLKFILTVPFAAVMVVAQVRDGVRPTAAGEGTFPILPPGRVVVVNTASDPVPVVVHNSQNPVAVSNPKDSNGSAVPLVTQDAAASHAFQIQVSETTDASGIRSSNGVSYPQAPLEIEYLDGLCDTSGVAKIMWLGISTQVGSTSVTHYFTPQPVFLGSPGDTSHWLVSQPVHFYSNPPGTVDNTVLHSAIVISAPAGSFAVVNCTITISGHTLTQ